MTRAQPKVALITGSGKPRIGKVIARTLAEHGLSIALHYHSSKDEAHQSVDELRAVGVDCEAFQADVALQGEVDAMFDAVQSRFGRLDLLVTTASTWDSVPLDQVTADDLWRDFNVNTLGTFLCAQRAGLWMVEQPEGGSIITIGDWAIERPYLNHAAYFVSKGAIPTLTRTLAVELAHRNPNVRVNCIHPGPVMFPPDCGDQEKRSLIDSTLVKSGNDPQVVADAVIFLMNNRFVTGVCLPVDGGRTIYAAEASSRKRPI